MNTETEPSSPAPAPEPSINFNERQQLLIATIGDAIESANAKLTPKLSTYEVVGVLSIISHAGIRSLLANQPQPESMPHEPAKN